MNRLLTKEGIVKISDTPPLDVVSQEDEER